MKEFVPVKIPKLNRLEEVINEYGVKKKIFYNKNTQQKIINDLVRYGRALIVSTDKETTIVSQEDIYEHGNKKII